MLQPQTSNGDFDVSCFFTDSMLLLLPQHGFIPVKAARIREAHLVFRTPLASALIMFLSTRILKVS